VRDVRGKSRSCDAWPVRFGREGLEIEEKEEKAGADCYLGRGIWRWMRLYFWEILGVSSH
jgi:hypothetical protein